MMHDGSAVMWYSCDTGLTLDIPYGLVVHLSGGRILAGSSYGNFLLLSSHSTCATVHVLNHVIAHDRRSHETDPASIRPT
jgi:hypothetical protein